MRQVFGQKVSIEDGPQKALSPRADIMRNMHLSFTSHGHHFLEEVSGGTFSRLGDEVKTLIALGLANDMRYSYLHGDSSKQAAFVLRLVNKCIDETAEMTPEGLKDKIEELVERNLTFPSKDGFDLSEAGMEFLKNKVHRGPGGRIREVK